MDLVASLPAFLLAVLLISASPGPAMALILRRAALRGFRAAVPTVLGLELGLYVWALLAAAGFAALVAASEVAFLVLRVVGAVVLVGLGVQAWRAAWRQRRGATVVDDDVVPAAAAGRRGWWTALGEGLLVQLANPKAAVFMIAFYPQFVPADRPLVATTALLALVQVVVETVLYLSLAAGVARAGAWFRRRRVRQALEAVSGTVLVGLGVRVAVTSR
ncbi:MAG TPA: LysE family translocator [Geodermatophilus sp.]|nr:LysE family translocator [Geodermatophilus sp.]